MVRARTSLEGTYMLTRILKIKKWLYIGQLALLLGLGAVLLIFGGASRDPLYIPVTSFLYFVIVMLFVISIESFFFRIIEIRYSPSESRKFLMAKNSSSKALTIIIISGIIAGILFAPPFDDFASNRLSKNETLDARNDNVPFTTQDRLGLSKVEGVTVTISGGSGYVYILSPQDKDDFLAGDFSALDRKLNPDPFLDHIDPTFEYVPNSDEFTEYYVVYNSASDTGDTVKIDVHVKSAMSRTFLFYVPLLAVAFAVSNLVWMFYLRPIQKKYATASIYT